MNAFGFSDANIFIENSGENNAATFSSSMSIDLGSDKLFKSAKKASSKTNGFKFSKEDDVIFMMVLYTGMLVNPEYTDAELTAIILHDIAKIHFCKQEISSACIIFFTIQQACFRCLS